MTLFLPSSFTNTRSSWSRRLLLAGLCYLSGLQAQAQYVSSFAPTTGVAGTAVTLTGSGFTGATAVTFGGVAAATFTVNSATSITAVAPVGVATGYVHVTAPSNTGSGNTPTGFVVKQPTTRTAVVMDGYREVLYGNPLAVQANPTGFGNATNGSQMESISGSELDAVYTYVQGDSLHVLLTGNLENNSNALDVFFDAQPGGQNTLTALGSTMPYNNLVGLTFDQGFGADYALIIETVNSTVYAQFSNLITGTVSALGSGFGRTTTFRAGNYTGRLGMDQSNTGGIDDVAVYGAAPASVVTGVEFVLPLAALGSPTGSLKMASFLGNGMQNYLSNQALGTLPTGTANLMAPGVVNFNNYAGSQYATVPLQNSGVPITSYAPANGVAGTAVTIIGSGFTGATAVTFGGVAAASFVVNSSTSITAVVPVGAATGPLAVATTAGPSASTTSFTVDQPQATTIRIDGYRETRYGIGAVQTTPTGFGNATNGDPAIALNGSELDAAYTYVRGDSLYVFLAGNLENNGNQVELFFDSQPGGQNTLTSTNPNVDSNGLNALAGLTFDQGFTADYYLSIKANAFAPNLFRAYFASLGVGGVGVSPASTELYIGSYILNLPGGRTGQLGIDNSNTGGVSATSVGVGVPNAVVRGVELVLPLAALNFPSGSLKVAAFVNGGNHTVMSNQTLGGLPNGTANLASPSTVNFVNYAGDQYFTVPIPAAPPVLTRFSPTSGLVGTTTVSIFGTGLVGATSVSFNGTPAPGFTLNADGNILTVQVPVGATAGPISVTTAGGTSTTTTSFCAQYVATVANFSRCGPGSVTLSASGAPVGSIYTYYSDRFGGTILGTGTTFTTNVNYSATLYVGITTGSSAAACEGPRTAFSVTINSLPTATITAASPTTICQGGSVLLTASLGSAYLWSNGATTRSISAMQAGSYTVTVTNSDGCSATSAATTLVVNPQPTVSITASGPTTFCYGGGVLLTASPGNYYHWSTGDTSPSIYVRQPGSYTVQVSDGISCGGTSAATVVTVNMLPTADITASTSTNICQGSSVMLTATAGSSYLWSTGAITQSITVSQAGSYTVQVGNGTCTAISAPTTVTVSPLPAAIITTSGPTTICQNGSGSTVLTASTGASYLWSTGAATQSITVMQPGTYTVQVGNGTCTATSVPTVIGTAPAPVQPTITQTSVGGVTMLTSSASSGNQWYRNGVAITGATGQTYLPTSAGNYTVVVTAANGCASSASAGQAIVLATASAIVAAQMQGYPNPTRGEITFNLPSNVSIQAVRVEVFNTLGQQVSARIVINSAGIHLNITGLATGVYTVRMQLGTDTLVKRVVLE